MKDLFNLVSLANLTRTELIAMLANLKAQLIGALSDTERTKLQNKITKVSQALTLG